MKDATQTLGNYKTRLQTMCNRIWYTTYIRYWFLDSNDLNVHLKVNDRKGNSETTSQMTIKDKICCKTVWNAEKILKTLSQKIHQVKLFLMNKLHADLPLSVAVVEELVSGSVTVMAGDSACRGDTDLSWGRLGLVGPEDDVEEDLEALLWFPGEWADCDTEGSRDLLFTWAVPVKTYHYILNQHRQNFLSFSCHGKSRREVGKKISLPTQFQLQITWQKK